MMSTTYVYLGPTLNHEEARRYLPNAIYLPPIQCGDLLSLLALKPKCILIIDGYYEYVGSVWHKEILKALDEGVMVIGASSMGALRAVEMHPYGMIGVGEIYQDFMNGTIADDDEVAVLHADATKGYTEINDAMVNIRSTIKQARLEKVIFDEEVEALIALAKKTFYPERRLLFLAEKLLVDYPKLDIFIVWLRQHGVKNQKRLDAINALQYLRNGQIIEARSTKNFEFQDTTYVRSLQNISDIKPNQHLVPLLTSREEIEAFALLKDKPRLSFLIEEMALYFSALEKFVEFDDRAQKIDQISQISNELNFLYACAPNIKDVPDLEKLEKFFVSGAYPLPKLFHQNDKIIHNLLDVFSLEIEPIVAKKILALFVFLVEKSSVIVQLTCSLIMSRNHQRRKFYYFLYTHLSFPHDNFPTWKKRLLNSADIVSSCFLTHYLIVYIGYNKLLYGYPNVKRSRSVYQTWSARLLKALGVIK